MKPYQTPLKKHPLFPWAPFRFLFPLLALGAAAFGPSPAAAQATHFKFISPPSSPAGLYTTTTGSNSFTVQVQALSASNAVVTGFSDDVVANLESTATSQISDPQAIYSGGVTGSLTLSFVSGIANFSVTFAAGSNSEQIVLQDLSAGPVTQGTSYPGTLGITAGAAITVRGFMGAPLFPQDPNFNVSGLPNPPTDDTPLTYTSGGATDPLSTSGVTYYYQDYGDIVPKAGGVTGTSGIDYKASCYAYPAYSGGYAAGGAGVSVNFYFAASVATTPVTYQVILDYDGSLTDFNNPNPAKDTVLQGTFPCGTAYGPDVAAPVTVAGFQPYQPFMQGNGQVILRVWTGAGDSATIKYANNTQGPPYDPSVTSYIEVPYSPSNVQPLLSTVTAPSYTGIPPSPPYVLAGYSPTTIIDTFKNQYSGPLTQIAFQIPADPLGATNWVISSVPAPTGPNPGSSTGILQASTTNPGAVTLNFSSSNPVTTNEVLPITIIGQAPATNYSWPLSILSATTNTGANAPFDSSSVNVNTLEAPDTPGSFAALPANYPGTGGQISLSWNQSVSQSPLGYVLSRNPAGGVFTSPVTLPSGLVVSNAITITPASTAVTLDTNATNLTGYTYSIKSFNTVTQSAAANAGPVSAYADPGAPSPLAALTGGTTVQLNWAAPASVAGSYPVAKYQIYRGTSSNGESTTPIATVNAPTVTYNDLPPSSPGTTYYYYLSTVDNQYSSGPTLGPHDSGPSAEVAGFPPGNPPNNAGVSLAVIGPPATLAVTWSAPVSDLNAITSYYIWKETDSGAFSALVTVGAAAVSVWDGAVTTGHTYSYFVQAVDSLNNVSNDSATVTGQVGPSAPTGLAAIGYAGSVTLTWNSNASNQNVVNYLIERNGSPMTLVPAPASGPVTGFDTTLVQGVNYGYQVAGINNTGVTGTFCAAVTSSLAPLSPQNFTASLQQTGVSFNVDLSWTAPVSSANLQYYNIRAGTTAGGTLPVTLGLPATFVSYQSPQPTSSAGTTFYYLMRAGDPGGVSPIPATLALQMPPNPPVIQPAAATAATITVNWNARPVTEDVSHYTVYRSTLPTSGFTSIGTSATASYSDGTGPVAGTDYYYEVTATNPGGGVGIPGGESLPSGSVTAALAPAVPVGLNATLNPATDNVALTWTSQSGAEANLATYTLYRTENGGPVTTLQTAAASVTTFSDTLVTPANAGQTILYYLFATNNAGANSTLEGPVGLQVPPNPPTGVGAAPSSNAVTVLWTAIAGQNVSQYTVYRIPPAGTPTVVAIASPGTANSVTDLSPPLVEGVAYQYFVTATNPGGGTGVPGGTSADSTTITSGLGAPVPTGLVVSGIDTSNDIGVTWTPVTIAVPNATAVSLFSGPTSVFSSASATQLAPTVSNFTYSSQLPDTTYYYWLETLNTFGPSTPEGPVTQLTYPAPVSTQSVTLDADGVSRDITWTPVGGGDVVSYNIYREQIGGSGYVSVGSVAAAGLTFPVKRTSSVLPGKLYAYQITAVNATGEGGSQNAVTVGVPPDNPSSVTALSGVTTTAAVSLTWAEPNGPSEGVTGYTVYRETGAAPNFSTASPVTTGLTVTNYLDNTSLAGTTYYYWVEADATDGTESLPTTATSSVTIAAAAQPNPPTGFTEADGNASVSLTWTAAVTTTFPIAGYNLYDSANGGATVKANATPVAGSPYALSGLSNGTTYIVWAQAVDSHGNLSPLSAAVTGYPDAPPGIPGSVSAESGNEAVQVTWKSAVPGTLPIGSYVVYENLLPSGPATYITVAGNLTGDVITGLSNASTYVCEVEALDSSGVTTGTHASGFSGPTTVIPNLNVNPPGNVLAKGGVGQVVLTWSDAVTGLGQAVTGYTIYGAQGSGSYSPVGNIAVGPQAVTETGLTNGTSYSYYLVASSGTTVSSDSATVFATPANPPNAPVSFLNVDGSNSVSLSWSSAGVVVNNVPVSQYVLLVGSSPVTAVGGSNLSVTDSSGIANANSYIFQVEAVNSNGTTGALSAAVTGYPYVPFPPTVFAGTDSAAAVTLSWTAPGGTTWPVTGYDYIRTPLGGGSAVTIAAAGSPASDTTASLGQAYLYTLTATDSKGHVSTAAGPVTAGPCNPPAAPTTVVATAGNQQVLLDWPASAPVSGSLPVSLYLLTLNGGAPVTLPASQTWYLDNNNGLGLTNPAAVTAVVQALDVTGNPTGNDVSVTVPGGPVTTAIADLNPPTALSASVTGTSSVKLTWARPNDEGFPVTAYNIYRSTSFTTSYGSPIATIVNPALSPVTVYNDIGVSPNTTYYYVVAAIYSVDLSGPGPIVSPYSNHALAVTPAPGTPVPPVTVGQMAFDANLVKPGTGQVLGIYFVAPDSGPAQINVYNISGNPIRALYATSTAGQQENLAWDIKDRNGHLVASGLYIIEIKAPGLHQIKKVLVVK